MGGAIMPTFNEDGYMEMTFINIVKAASYLWLFCSILAGIVRGVQYLYAHLQWIA
jgi:hypothetical protein